VEQFRLSRPHGPGDQAVPGAVAGNPGADADRLAVGEPGDAGDPVRAEPTAVPLALALQRPGLEAGKHAPRLDARGVRLDVRLGLRLAVGGGDRARLAHD